MQNKKNFSFNNEYFEMPAYNLMSNNKNIDNRNMLNIMQQNLENINSIAKNQPENTEISDNSQSSVSNNPMINMLLKNQNINLSDLSNDKIKLISELLSGIGKNKNNAGTNQVKKNDHHKMVRTSDIILED